MIRNSKNFPVADDEIDLYDEIIKEMYINTKAEVVNEAASALYSLDVAMVDVTGAIISSAYMKENAAGFSSGIFIYFKDDATDRDIMRLNG